MSEDRTVRVAERGRPVKGIRAEVVGGPDKGKQVACTDGSLTVGSAEGNDLVLADPTVSRIHVTLGRRDDRILVTDHGSTNATQVGPAEIRGATMAVETGTTLRLGRTRLRLEDGEVVMVDDGPDQLGELRARDPQMRLLMAKIGRIAESEVPVLVSGESGTGKELIARAIHDQSDRREQPFVTVDCAALTPSLLESELFGHERGAFTGAERQHIGACERSSGGTLFLDEVGELPLGMQSTLLGVLERHRIRRLGGRDEIPLDLRVIAATNRDLRAEVNHGSFRLDLFYRIAVVRLDVMPLRDRPRDIPMLIEHFITQAGRSGAAEELFDAETLERLRNHPWPGNVRELRNVVLGALALGEAPTLGGHAPEESAEASLLDLSFRDAKRQAVDAFERRYLRHNLDQSEGNIRETARRTRMDRSYLMELMKRHGMR